MLEDSKKFGDGMEGNMKITIQDIAPRGRGRDHHKVQGAGRGASSDDSRAKDKAWEIYGHGQR